MTPEQRAVVVEAMRSAVMGVPCWRVDGDGYSEALNVEVADDIATAALDAAVAAMEAAGLVVVPVEPTDEMRVAAVSALGKRRGELAERYRAPGEEKLFALALMADSTETDPVYRAMIAARPR